MRSTIKYVYLFIVLCFLQSYTANAAHEKVNGRLQGSSFQTSQILSIFDNKYPALSALSPVNFKEANSKTLVKIGVDNYSTTSSVAYDLTINVLLSYKTYASGPSFISNSNTFALTVKYDPVTNNVTYPDLSAYVVNGGYAVAVKVVSIYNNLTSAFITTAPANLYLEAEIDAERYYDLDYTYTPYTFPSAVSNPMIVYYDAATNEHLVKWAKLEGAEEYDLEWCWVSNDVVTPFAPVIDFKNNSTRIRTTDQFYRVTNIFERGYVFFRLRGVGRYDINNNQKFEGYYYSPWTWDDVTTISNFLCTSIPANGVKGISSALLPLTACNSNDHENLKNWQYSATYAEEGKKKEVISYFDGTLRNRQSVTKNNSDNNAIVGETFYDYTGRAAVQALPVPVADATIKFYEYNVAGKWGFNFSNTTPQLAYNKKHFDEDGATCPPTPLGMHTVHGSANYYSSSNPDKTFQQAYVPEAENYPFVQTEFTPDNTGRIRRQGGTGDNLRLGSNHETKYFYGSPTGQNELDRLFGSEVGYYTHYKKNMVIDPNGQVSITYLDQSGRTIATALAGDKPDNVKSLATPYSPLPLTEDLLNKKNLGDFDTPIDNNILSQNGKELIFSKEMLVTDQQYYKFTYDMTGTAFTYTCSEVCYDCIYTLEIDIRDNCNNWPAGFTPIKKIVGNVLSTQINEEFQTVAYETNCDGPIQFTDLTATPINVLLDPGQYTVYKKLSLDEKAMNFYLNDLIENNSCTRSEQSFIDEETAAVDISGCDMTCEACVTSLGTASAFIANGGTQAQFDELVKSCREPCEYTSVCESNYISLLADVSPGGQYADWDDGGNCNPSAFPLSVLNTSNLLPKKFGAVMPHWDESTLNYKNDDGTPSLITIMVGPGSTYSPPVKSTSIPTTSYPAAPWVTPNSFTIAPHRLNNACDFVLRWKKNWAKELVKFHPEYPYYEWCIQNSQNNDGQRIQVTINVPSNPPYTADINSSKDYDSLLLIVDDLTYITSTDQMKLVDPLGILASNTPNDPYFVENQSNYWYLPTGGISSNFSATPANTVSTNQYNSNLTLNGRVYRSAIDRFRNYQGSGLNLWQFAYAMTSGCVTMYNSVLTPTTAPCWASFPSPVSNMTNAAWAKFKMLYQSLKQELQNEAAESYATNAPIPTNAVDAHNSCNDCIGNGNYVYFFVPFAVRKGFFPVINNWTDNWFLFPPNGADAPCGMFNKDLYASKIKRFQSMSDVTGLASTSNTGAGVYQTTGKCPVAMDLEVTLNTLAQNNVITTALQLNNYPAFTKLLYDHVMSGPQLTYLGLGWQPTVSGLNLMVQFIDGTTPVCTLNVDFPTSSTIYDWSTIGTNPIVNLYNIKFLAYASGVSTFKIDADIQTGTSTYTTITLNGSICGNIGACAFDPVCEPNGNAQSLAKLIRTLVAGGDFCNSGISLSNPPYNSAFTNTFGQLLPTSTSWSWNFTTPNAVISAPSITEKIDISFDATGVNALCSLMVANPNLLITSCLPDPGGSVGDFIINYSYVMGTVTTVGSFGNNNISITNASNVTTALSMGDCDIVDPFCNTPEHKVRKDLEEFLQDAVVKSYFMNTTSATTVNITTNPMFSNLLQSYITTTASVNSSANITQTNYYFYTNAGSASNTFSFSLCSENSTTPPAINSKCCALTFSLNPSLSKTQNDITSLGKLFVSPNPTFGGQSYSFKMLAQFGVGGPVDTLYGSTTCFPIRDCAPCTNTVDYSTMSTTSIWTENFETSSGFTMINNDTGTDCGSFTNVSSLSAPQNLNSPCLYAVTGSVLGGTFTLPYYETANSYFVSLGAISGSPSENTSVYKLTKSLTTTTSDKCYGFSGHFIKHVDKDHELELWINGTYVGKQYIPFEGYSVTPTWHLLNFGGATYKLPSGSTSISIEIIAKPILISGMYTGQLTTLLGLDKLGLWEVPCGFIPCVNEFKPDTFPVITYTNPCAQLLMDAAINNGKDDYANYIDSLKADFIDNYIKKCMGSVIENFKLDYDGGEYHYTLYYYDQAGNLVRTVPPEGVAIVPNTSLGQVKTDRYNYPDPLAPAKVYFTGHTMKTTYTYNSLNQLNKQETPDAGESRFWYDRLGRMVASQNAKQFNASPKDYSYTKYDALGRIKEVGQIPSGLNLRTMPMYDPMPLLCLDGILNDATYPVTLNASPGVKNQVTTTYYGDDLAYASIASIASAVYTTPADYLRTRVAATCIEDLDDNTATTYNHATYYNYDVHGNVRELVQHNPALTVVANHEKKLIQYEYDLISGKVNKVKYQPGSVDQFYHQYDYDAENRLTHVYTSKDNYLWDLDNKYFYYKHGPLARVETGDSKVNGTDYAYTLQGWIKGVNSNILTQTNDIGKDGFNTTSSNYSDLHKMFGRDAYGYSLNYYGHLTTSSAVVKDYNPIDATYASTANNFIADYATNLGSTLHTSSTPTAPALYNGNISHMVTSYINSNPAALIPGTTNAVAIGQAVPQLSAYWYDQLNRIKEVNTFKDINLGTNTWGASSGNEANAERFSYDANGNLTTVQRRGNTSPGNVTMDNMIYNYITGTNKLSHVDDGLGLSGNYTDDIDDQAPTNYTYDEIGNLITDNQELITNIEWTVYGKIKKITRTNNTRADLTFNYDAQGNRISKRAHIQGQPASRDEITYYLRDAQGNVMSVYTEKGDFLGIPTLYLTEQHLFGSSRIGLLNRNIDLKVVTTPPTVMDRITGDKFFELSNHLGNVIAVIPDRKIPVVSGPSILSYSILPISTSDYMAFGAPMPGRNYTSASYRYSFNGKEKDPETNATGGSTQDYGMRIYNPSLGKFLSVDPITDEYPELTPYQFAGNTPIQAIDLDGLEPYLVMLETAALEVEAAAPAIEQQLVRALQVGFAGSELIKNLPMPKSLPKNNRFGGRSTNLPSTNLIPGTNTINNARNRVKLKVEKAENVSKETNQATKNRVKLRKDTKEKIKENQPKNEKGEPIDPNDKKPLGDDPVDVGHKNGQEWWRRKKIHDEKGSSRPEVIEEENNPDLYQLERRSNNRGHKYEKPK